MSIRPCIILGPGVNNFLSDSILKSGKWSLWMGNDAPLQFVHEVDVARAILTILENNGKRFFCAFSCGGSISIRCRFRSIQRGPTRYLLLFKEAWIAVFTRFSIADAIKP